MSANTVQFRPKVFIMAGMVHSPCLHRLDWTAALPSRNHSANEPNLIFYLLVTWQNASMAHIIQYNSRESLIHAVNGCAGLCFGFCSCYFCGISIQRSNISIYSPLVHTTNVIHRHNMFSNSLHMHRIHCISLKLRCFDYILKSFVWRAFLPFSRSCSLLLLNKKM